LERSELNWRGVVVFGLAVLTVILLIIVIDDEPAPLGVNTADTSQGGDDTATTTTAPSGGSGATSTTAPGGGGGGGGTTTTTTPAIDPAGKPTLQVGSSGSDVMLVQQKLSALGIYTGPVDGAYGPGTATAVTTFQTQKGITPADGVVGPSTWTALANA
jgi:peptidoglycan hydrolase-like protein with peptidoglycan-binding domain